MLSPRRSAQIGLVAASVVLVSCFGILISQGGDRGSTPQMAAPALSAPAVSPSNPHAPGPPLAISLSTASHPHIRP